MRPAAGGSRRWGRKRRGLRRAAAGPLHPGSASQRHDEDDDGAKLQREEGDTGRSYRQARLHTRRPGVDGTRHWSLWVTTFLPPPPVLSLFCSLKTCRYSNAHESRTTWLSCCCCCSSCQSLNGAFKLWQIRGARGRRYLFFGDESGCEIWCWGPMSRFDGESIILSYA